LGVSGRKTNLSDAKADAEVAYRGIAAKWVDTHVSIEEARRWLEHQYPEDRCSFCDKLPFEFEAGSVDTDALFVRTAFGSTSQC